MPFSRTVTIGFDDADPAGILFYGRLLQVAHRVFEDFVVSELAECWDDWFSNDAFIVPIRRAESEFHRPLRPGRRYQADLFVSKVGTSSFEVTTKFWEGAGGERHLSAETRVVHVFAHPSRFEKLPIPGRVRARLEAHLAGE